MLGETDPGEAGTAPNDAADIQVPGHDLVVRRGPREVSNDVRGVLPHAGPTRIECRPCVDQESHRCRLAGPRRSVDLDPAVVTDHKTVHTHCARVPNVGAPPEDRPCQASQIGDPHALHEDRVGDPTAYDSAVRLDGHVRTDGGALDDAPPSDHDRAHETAAQDIGAGQHHHGTFKDRGVVDVSVDLPMPQGQHHPVRFQQILGFPRVLPPATHHPGAHVAAVVDEPLDRLGYLVLTTP